MKKLSFIIWILISFIVTAPSYSQSIQIAYDSDNQQPQDLSKINWHICTGMSNGLIEMGLVDHDGGMTDDYIVTYIIIIPDGKQYQTNRSVTWGYGKDFSYVYFPKDFNTGSDSIQPGVYQCKYVIDGKLIVKEQFKIINGRLSERKIWWIGKGWTDLEP